MDQVMPPDASKRLLNTSTYQLHFDNDDDFLENPRYAIVSHRWLKKEITFQTLQLEKISDDSANSPQLKKIRGACKKARAQGINWLWLDSTCINKANMVEDATAIKSMFEWYRDSSVCYTYLSDVVLPSPSSAFEQIFDRSNEPGNPSEWFERGWTLQELLAPERMEFYDRDWTFMGTKASLAKSLAATTRIDISYLNGKADFRKANIAVKMSWMAGRKTSKVEDLAFSMLGIFDVDMNISYAHGARTFIKLQEEIILRSSDESIFAWTTPPSGLPETNSAVNSANDEWGMLAPSPDCFRHSGEIRCPDKKYPRLGGYKIEQSGLVFRFPGRDSKPGWMSEPYFAAIAIPIIANPIVGSLISISKINLIRNIRKLEFAMTLNCLNKDKKSNEWRPVQIYLRRSIRGFHPDSFVFRRHRCSELGLTSNAHLTASSKNKPFEMTILHPYPKG